jgi:hypothetical protein
MEGLAAASSVIAVVGLAGQALQGCQYLRNIFSEARDAPRELQLLDAEIGTIQRILHSVQSELLCSTSNITAEVASDATLDFCADAIRELRDIVDKYGQPSNEGGRVKWGKRLSVTLNSSKIDRHLSRLRAARGHLISLQTALTM